MDRSGCWRGACIRMKIIRAGRTLDLKDADAIADAMLRRVGSNPRNRTRDFFAAAIGVALFLENATPALDLVYLDEVDEVVERLRAPAYSEHLAFTRVPGRETAALMPLPKTEAVAESIIAKVRTVQSRVPFPFLLENITYVFEWPDSKMSDAEFLNLICRETGAGLLLDVENVYLNATNHGFDPRAFIDALRPGLVREVHMAGGITISSASLARPLLADSHSHPVPDAALDLLEYTLARQTPSVIILERDDRLEAGDEILDDIARIRARVAAARSGETTDETHGEALVGAAG